MSCFQSRQRLFPKSAPVVRTRLLLLFATDDGVVAISTTEELLMNMLPVAMTPTPMAAENTTIFVLFDTTGGEDDTSIFEALVRGVVSEEGVVVDMMYVEI